MHKQPIQRPLLPSPSFFNYFLLIFQICTVQWLNCRNLKDELNFYHNGGGVVYVLQSEISYSTRQYYKSYDIKKHSNICRMNYFHHKQRYNSIIRMYQSKWLQTWSIPICLLRSHSLVCIENHLFLLGIWPIRDK